MKEKFKLYWKILKETYNQYMNSNVFIDSAGLAYYAVFSIPGLLIIIVWLAGLFFGEEVVRGEIGMQVEQAIGGDAAESIQSIMKDAMIDKDNFLMKTIGVLTLLFGATTLFFMLQKALNQLWGIEPKPKQAMMKYVKDRISSLGIIIIIGFLMTITMILSTILSSMSDFITNEFGMQTYYISQVINYVVGFLLVMSIFSIIFKVLPDVDIQWKAVYVGAFVTTILFTLGKYLINVYFANFEPASVYGAAGTVILIMIWINYSFLIVLFGAIFTKVNAIMKNLEFSPSDHAKWDEKEDSKLQVNS